MRLLFKMPSQSRAMPCRPKRSVLGMSVIGGRPLEHEKRISNAGSAHFQKKPGLSSQCLPAKTRRER